MPVVTSQATSEQLESLWEKLPKVLSGAAPDPWGVAQGLQLRLGMVLLSKIRQDFETKSRGGTGEDGIKWVPLTKQTIANRRPAPRKRKDERPRGLLTADEDARWSKIFAQRKARFLLQGESDKEASIRAAKIAWTILKEAGAKTKLDVFGNRVVDILRDTSKLFNSFSPGVHAEGQIFRTPPGRVIVGTNQRVWHHEGVPGKLPARPFFPPDGNLPESWWRTIISQYRQGLLEAMMQIMTRRAA